MAEKAIDLQPEERRWHYQGEYKAGLRLYQVRQPYHRQYLFVKQIIGWWTLDQIKGKSVLDSSDYDLHGNITGEAKVVSDTVRGKVLSLDGATATGIILPE